MGEERAPARDQRERAVADLPDSYAAVLASLKSEVRAARLRAHRVVNTELLVLYWTIGRAILDQQAAEGWGTGVINRLADDLRSEFPEMRGIGRSNVHYMRAMAAAWPRTAVVQRAVGQLPWGHITVLLDKLDDQAQRDWYAAKAIENGWSRDVLRLQIIGRLQDRLGAAPSNFADQLPAADSDLAQQLTKDPYVFEFLDLHEHAAERDVERALMDRLQQTLLEFGRGFAFVGRPLHFEVGGDDFYADLVLFHVEQLRYVVVELKIGKFKPGYVGQLGFYVAVVDDQLRRQQIHAPTVGILLCASRNDSVVRYSLANTTAPMAVANYTDQPALDPSALHLPQPGELTAILNAPLAGQTGRTLGEALPDELDDTDNDPDQGP
ncbi:MAG: PDDEXK nuclease domain-containing protein [Actinomycetota bacterium]|nr:PDDEXK nuclease domain-containing protein [Actinomycetota bacterium]